jgi:cytochrome c biogenesis protein CcmG, thiol:disulfide interchange protein DsbE
LKRLLAFAPLIVLCLLLGVLGWYNFHKRAQFEPRAVLGQGVPTAQTVSLRDGASRDLKTLASQYKKPILINVFASWCTPCLAENPLLVDLKAKGVVIIGIAYKDQPVGSLNYLKTNGDPYTDVLSDEDGQLGLRLGISGVPETFLVTPDGIIRDKIGGPLTEDNMAALQPALNAR